jgi:hypothetical protein
MQRILGRMGRNIIKFLIRFAPRTRKLRCFEKSRKSWDAHGRFLQPDRESPVTARQGETSVPNPAVTLSSPQTFAMKFVFPTIWVGVFAAVTITSFLSSDSPFAAATKWRLMLTIIISGIFIWWTCMRLKRVRMDSQFLYISNFATELVVPLRDVVEVTENVWTNIHPVTIKFRSETVFGSQVVFMPPQRWFAFWSSHPVVAEIRDAVARAGGGSYGRPGT